MAFIRSWKDRLEYLQDVAMVLPETSGKSFHTQGEDQQESVKRENCWIHNLDGMAGEHPIWKCKQFLNQAVEERIQSVGRHKACKVCLLTVCSAVSNPEECKSRFRCYEDGCSRAHHNRLLHQRPVQAIGTTAHVQEDPDKGIGIG